MIIYFVRHATAPERPQQSQERREAPASLDADNIGDAELWGGRWPPLTLQPEVIVSSPLEARDTDRFADWE